MTENEQTVGLSDDDIRTIGSGVPSATTRDGDSDSTDPDTDGVDTTDTDGVDTTDTDGVDTTDTDGVDTTDTDGVDTTDSDSQDH
jgi:hypothetical protein